MKLTLISKTPEAGDAWSLLFQPETPLSWQAGQFIVVKLPVVIDTRGTERYFTISAAPFENQVRITTRYFGEKSSPFKQALFSLPIGTVVETSEPMGEFVISGLSASYILVAGGIGITPFRAILKDLVARKASTKVTLMYGNRSNEIVFKDEFDEIAKTLPNLTINYFVAPTNLISADIFRAAAEMGEPKIYISGPTKMVDDLQGELEGMGVAKDRLKHDHFIGYEGI